MDYHNAIVPKMRSTHRLALFLSFLLILGGGIVTSYLAFSPGWEVTRREREIERYNAIIAAIKADPNNTALYEELVAAKRRSNAWDRTQMFARMRDLGSVLQQTEQSRAGFRSILLPVIQQGLHDPSGFVRREAALSAAAFGPLSTPAVPELIAVLYQYPEEDTARFAAVALGNIGPGAAEAIPALQRATTYSPFIGEEAQLAIAKIRRRQADGNGRKDN
jgi:hypothetical protein